MAHVIRRRSRHARTAIHIWIEHEDYLKAKRIAATLEIPMGDYINLLIRRDRIDENGRPLWAPDLLLVNRVIAALESAKAS